MVKKSINQYQCNIIALSKNNKATTKALDKASLKQSSKHLYSNRESTFDINKQRNNETTKPLNNETNRIDLIFPFETDSFKNTWNQFIEFRKSIKKPLKEISQQAQLLKLSEYPEQVATEMILQSIANGWQGIFELKNQNQNGKSNPNVAEKPKERIIGRISESALRDFIAPRHGDKPKQDGNFHFEQQ